MRSLAASRNFVKGLGRSSHSGRYQGSGVIMEKVNTITPSFEVFLVPQAFIFSLHPHTRSTKMG